MKLDEIENLWIDGTYKGMPPGGTPFQLGEIGSFGWNVLRGDLSWPLAVLKQSALAHNGHWMKRFLALSGAKLCPHGKTSMAPQLFQQQLDDGAWGITLATAQQVCVARRFGVSRILLANQVTSRTAAEYLAREIATDPTFDFYCLVDSVAGMHMLSDAMSVANSHRPMQVLIEVGVTGKRCGTRDVATAMELAREIAKHSPQLQLSGIEGFEGVITGKDDSDTERQVQEFLDRLIEVAKQCDAENLFGAERILLTAGGSAFYDLVIDGFVASQFRKPVDIVIRSGCYLTHDSLVCERLFQRLLQRAPAACGLGTGLQSALQVWAAVQSRPEPTRAILSLGKRDVSFDIELPIPTHWHRPGTNVAPLALSTEHRIVGLNDQHGLLDLPTDSPLVVGDLVACGISHPCTTFDRWQVIPVVDDEFNVVAAIRTFF